MTEATGERMERAAWIVLSWREGEALLAYLHRAHYDIADFDRAVTVLANEVAICRTLPMPDTRNRYERKNAAVARDAAAGSR